MSNVYHYQCWCESRGDWFEFAENLGLDENNWEEVTLPKNSSRLEKHIMYISPSIKFKHKWKLPY